MLSLETVVGFLRQKGLIHESEIVDGSLVVRDVSRRNLGFTVMGESAPGFFLKQPRAADRFELVTSEARIYQWFDSLPRQSKLRPFLPRVRCFDADECTLVLDLVGDSCSLADLQWRRRRLPAVLGASLGRAVGALHRVSGVGLDTSAPDGPEIGPAARYLQLHRPNLQTFIRSSAGTIQLIRTIQASAQLCRHLDDLEGQWRVDSVIHADLRLDNCRVAEPPDHARGLSIVDWETAGTGDSCWDVGTFFAECLSIWLLSAPITRDSPPEAFVALARVSLPRMRPAIRGFWRAYVAERRVADKDHDEHLIRAVRYAGARLVQQAFIEVQHAAVMSATVVYLLQLALNIMERPVEAAVRLLGLPAPLVANP